MSIVDIRAALAEGLAGRASISSCGLTAVEGGRFQRLEATILLPEGETQILAQTLPRATDLIEAARELGRNAFPS